MSVVVKWSVVLAVLVTVLSIIVMAAGLHENPIVGGIVSVGLAILINVVVVVLALKQTAGTHTYGKQLLNGLLIGLVAGVLIFLSSWLLLAVVFPDYMDESRAAYTRMLEQSGLGEAQMEAAIAEMESATPVSQSFSGLLGTFFTSLIVAAIAAIFLRRK